MKYSLIKSIQDQIHTLTSRHSVQRRRRLKSISTEQLETRHMLSAVVELVQDFNTQPADGLESTAFLQVIGENLYFKGETTLHGNELWRSDGTASGTLRLTDIEPGLGSTSLSWFENLNGMLYFVAASQSTGTALWRSDGTVSGTTRVFEPPGSYIDYLTTAGSMLYLRAADGIWKSDGTPGGESLIPTLPGPIYGMQGSSELLFVAIHDSAADRKSLWVTDGTAEGTKLLKSGLKYIDLSEETSESVGGSLFFRASDATTGNELWVSDGTPDGTHLVKDVYPGMNSSDSAGDSMTSMGGVLYFEASSDGMGSELWRSDGTDEGTVLLRDTSPGSTYNGGYQFSVAEDRLYFRTYDQVWRSDGTREGTFRVASYVQGISANTPIVAVGQNVYFTVDTFQSRNLWRSDGTYDGTFRLTQFNLNRPFPAGEIASIVAAGSRVFFAATDKVHSRELWSTDGTVAGTTMIKDIRPGTLSSSLYNVMNADGDLFVVQDSYPEQLHRIRNGVTTTTYLDTIEYRGGSLAVGDDLYFLAGDRTYGREFWKWSGAVPELLKDVAPGLTGGVASEMTEFNGTLYFVARGPEAGLWKSDGTSEGTLLVRRIPSTPSGPFDEPGPLTIFTINGLMYFAARDENAQYNLWKSDGTSEGTILFQKSFAPFSVALLDGLIFWFSGYSSTALLFTDGTPENTRTISRADLDFDLPLNDVTSASFNGAVYFSGSTNFGKTELWRTRGTVESTELFLELSPDRFDNSILKTLTVVSGKLLFVNKDPVNGYGIWQSDGTREGTHVLKSFGSESRISSWSVIGDRVFFIVADPSTGMNSIWITDGSETGTIRVPHSLEPHLALPASTVFVEYSGGIAFVAATEAVGFEIFRIDTTVAVSPPTSLTINNYGEGVDLTWPDVAGAIQYDVWMLNLSDPSAPVIRKRVNDSRLTLLDDTGYVIADDLLSSAYRVWVVSLPVLGEPSAWSTPKDFVLGPDPVMQPMPAIPINATPTFRWTGPQEVVSYELWLSNRDEKTRPIYRTGLQSTSFAVIDPLPPAKYAVWVRGTRANGTTTDWSDLTEFEILALPVQLTSGKGDSRIPRPTFTWAAVTDATGYDVSVFAAGTSTLIYSANNVSVLTHTPLQDLPAGKFTVYVRALKGTRPLSAWGNGDALWLKLPPINLRSTATGVAWDAVPFAGSYTFELRDSRGSLVVPRQSQTGTTFDPAIPLTPGQYSLRVFTNFSNLSSNWSATYAFELFRPPVAITSSGAATVDATPTITWTSAPGAATYELVVTRSGSVVPVYARTGITTTSHRIDIPLTNGIHQIQVRWIFADGSRSSWSPAQQLLIGPAASLTYAAGKLSWSSVNAATNYELWINYLGSPAQGKIVYQPLYVGTSYTLPSTLPKGRYQTWLRAIRAENGQLYTGAWTSVVFEIV